jgi:hypothetical protein
MAAAPLFYGTWDRAAEEHARAEASQTIENAMAIYYGNDSTSIHRPVILRSTERAVDGATSRLTA